MTNDEQRAEFERQVDEALRRFPAVSFEGAGPAPTADDVSRFVKSMETVARKVAAGEIEVITMKEMMKRHEAKYRRFHRTVRTARVIPPA